ncbi:MAG: N-acetyltransferase [Armatimonadia bacterium]
MGIEYRVATESDLAGVAGIYLKAFPDSLQHFFGDRPPALQAVVDVFSLPLVSEPHCLTVAVEDGQIVGYCLAPAHASRIARAAVRRIGRLLLHWLTGRYDIGLTPLRLLAHDKLRMKKAHQEPGHDIDAHILSIAVDPACHSRGVGGELLKRGLQYLQEQGAEQVRLEVRPGNPAAVHLYEKFGFRTVGEIQDSQGPWLVMVRDLGGVGES